MAGTRRIKPRTPVRLYLEEWRVSCGHTQESLAKALRVDKMTIYRLETSERSKDHTVPSANVLAAIAEVYGIHSTDLYRHPDEPSADALLRGQPKETRDQAVRLIKALRN